MDVLEVALEQLALIDPDLGLSLEQDFGQDWASQLKGSVEGVAAQMAAPGLSSPYITKLMDAGVSVSTMTNKFHSDLPRAVARILELPVEGLNEQAVTVKIRERLGIGE